MNALPEEDRSDVLQRLAVRLTSDTRSMAELARLRRMDPRQPEPAFGIIQDLLGDKSLFASVDHLRRWALIIHCIALARGRHRSQAQGFGEALVHIHFGELRLQQLLRADLTVLFDLLPRIARRMAAQVTEANWWPIATLVLNAGPYDLSSEELDVPDDYHANQQKAEDARLQVARGFVIANASVSDR